MTRILVCIECGDVLAVGDSILGGSHEVEGTKHAEGTVLEIDAEPPDDATPDQRLAWGLSVAGDADEVKP